MPQNNAQIALQNRSKGKTAKALTAPQINDKNEREAKIRLALYGSGAVKIPVDGGDISRSLYNDYYAKSDSINAKILDPGREVDPERSKFKDNTSEEFSKLYRKHLRSSKGLYVTNDEGENVPAPGISQGTIDASNDYDKAILKEAQAREARGEYLQLTEPEAKVDPNLSRFQTDFDKRWDFEKNELVTEGTTALTAQWKRVTKDMNLEEVGAYFNQMKESTPELYDVLREALIKDGKASQGSNSQGTLKKTETPPDRDSENIPGSKEYKKRITGKAKPSFTNKEISDKMMLMKSKWVKSNKGVKLPGLAGENWNNPEWQALKKAALKELNKRKQFNEDVKITGPIGRRTLP
jgi:hypothetical protein